MTSMLCDRARFEVVVNCMVPPEESRWRELEPEVIAINYQHKVFRRVILAFTKNDQMLQKAFDLGNVLYVDVFLFLISVVYVRPVRALLGLGKTDR